MKTTSHTSADIFDTTSTDFETTALKESLTRPVLVEFWAPWCGPCKQLMPILEKLVTSKKGDIALAKVNIDANPELAQAFRVQSVPMVVALYQGQPVTAFAGLRPNAEIEKLVDQLIALHLQNQPAKCDIPALLKEAAACLTTGDALGAQSIYTRILEEDPAHVDAHVGMVRAHISSGHLDKAEALITGASAALQKDPRFAAARTAYQLACDAPQGDLSAIEAALLGDPQNCTLLFEKAGLCYAKGLKEQAAESLLSILRINRNWEEEKAKKQLLTYLESWGFADPVSGQTRRKLSTLLFS